MESLPLKVLNFGLQMPTGPSSGVVACILLVSSRLDCPGMSLAEVCATCLEMSMWSVIQWWCDFEVLQLKIIFLSFSKNINKYYTSLLSNNFDVKKIPISCSTNVQSQNLNIQHIKVLLSTKWQWVYFLQIKKS